MNINELVQALEHAINSNDAKTCKWCGASDYSVDKSFDDCLEQLILATLAVLRRGVNHPVGEPPDSDRIVLTLMRYENKKQWRLNSYHLGRNEGFWIFNNWNVIAWRELPEVE